MNQLKRISFKVLVIFSMVLLSIRAQCSWDDTATETECKISCRNLDFQPTHQIMAYLEARWIERQDCHSQGIYLTLSEDMTYSNQLVEVNWFTAEVKVKELIFDLTHVNRIETNAFNSTALQSVTKLTFRNMNLNAINKGIFNGLESLEVLAMGGASGRNDIADGVLDVLNGTLKQFTLIQQNDRVTQITIDGFTGSETMKLLEYVKFNYKLTSSITHKSFLGLLNVKILDLSECQIDTIGAGAFDPISKSIRELNLQNNLIKTLPESIFHDMLPNEVTKILLDGNQWDCECHLMPFKECLIENLANSNFVGTINCSTPTGPAGNSVVSADFCGIPTTTTDESTTVGSSTVESTIVESTTVESTTVESTTVESITVESTTVESTTVESTTVEFTTVESTTVESTTVESTTVESTTVESTTVESTTVESTTEEPYIREEFSQECYESGELPKTVTIKRPKASLTVNENEYGDVEVDVDTCIEKFVLLWFCSLDPEIHCAVRTASDETERVNGETKTIPISNLEEDATYTFCMMDHTEKSVSPVDCISYAKLRTSEQPWLLTSDKTLVISMAVLACFISLFTGMAIEMVVFKAKQIIKRNDNRKTNEYINKMLEETFQSSSTMGQQNRISNRSIDKEPPPLPERPYPLRPLDEPIYAVIYT